MDTEATKDFWWFFEQLWPTFVIALGIYGGGVTANRIALAFVPSAKGFLRGKTEESDPKWPVLFRAWAITRAAHPALVGVAVAFIPGLPRPEFISSQPSAVLWFGGFAGMLNGQVGLLVESITAQVPRVAALIVPWVRSKLGLPSQSQPPPALTPPAVPATPKPASDPSSSTETLVDADAEREAMEAEVKRKMENAP
jgi:hypothetical protein